MTQPARIQRSPVQHDTSKQAWKDHNPGPVDAQILAVIEQHNGACDHEIEAHTGLMHTTVSGNRRHLVERGLVHASEERRLTPSGRKAVVWKLGKAQRETLTLTSESTPIREQISLLDVPAKRESGSAWRL